MENKITLEITAHGWTKTAFINGVEKKVVWELTSTGAKSISEELEDDKTVSDELYEAMESLDGYKAARFLEEL